MEEDRWFTGVAKEALVESKNSRLFGSDQSNYLLGGKGNAKDHFLYGFIFNKFFDGKYSSRGDKLGGPRTARSC